MEKIYTSNIKVKMNRYKRKYTEIENQLERPVSDLPDSDFAIILDDGTKLFPIDNKDRAQSSLNKLSQNLTPEQYKLALQKIQMRYPGLQPIGKKEI